jgi:hypothetical protein
MKKISVAVLLLSLLTACGGSDSEPDPFEMLSGSWQRMSGDSLTENYIYFDGSGTRRDFSYHGDTGCYTESKILYPYTRHVGENLFVTYGLSGNNSNIYYDISTDGNYLTQGRTFVYNFLKSDFPVSYFVNLLCE